MASAATSAPRRRLRAVVAAAVTLATSAAGLLAPAVGPGAAASAAELTAPATASSMLTVHDRARGRTLQVHLLRPAAPGRHPLVVVGHGLGRDGASALANHAWLAAKGYVVAAPTFPESSKGSTRGLHRQPGDVSSVITTLLRSPATSRSIDAARIGYLGSSFGGMTGMLLRRTTYADSRIDAIVARMAQDSTGAGRSTATPLLMIHGDEDRTVPYAAGLRAYSAAARPKAFLTLEGQRHAFRGGSGRLANDASLAFLDAHLRGGPDGWKALTAIAAAHASTTRLSVSR